MSEIKYCQTVSAYTNAITPCDQKSRYDQSTGLHFCTKKNPNLDTET